MPQNLTNNPAFQLVLVLVFSGAIVYAGINFFPNTAAMEEQIAALETDIGSLQETVNEGLKLEKRLPELRKTIREKEKQLETLKKVIPTTSEAEDLIRKLEHMASETAVSIRSFTPQPSTPKDFYYEWPILLTTTGNYHNLGRFFAKISNYARIINVRGVSINAVASVPGNPNETISANFTAMTYVYKEEKEN